MFVSSFVYDLPMGKGKRWGSSMHPVANGILGNWQMGGILSLHTGFPLTIQDNDRSGTTSRGPRANCIGDPAGPQAVGPGAKWFNLGAFQPTRTGTLGNCGVGTVRGPGLSTFSFAVQKKFPVREAKSFEFRSEFYNLTNTPIFGGPTRNVNSPLFGEIRGAQGERNIQFALKFYF